MRSKASIHSHPLHPILVSFPIAFLFGTFGFDLASVISGNAAYWQTGRYLEIAGIGMGILAAIPGFIDYLYTVPPKSSARKRGAKHGLLNVLQLVIFSIALILRTHGNAGDIFVLVAEAAGVVIICFTGWMGATLIYRNQIAVDPRYAEAGKWKEEYVEPSKNKIKVATHDELKINQMKLLHVGSRRIVIARTEDGYKAFEDRCSHRGGSLAGGVMICSTVQCPWHGSQFHVVTGEVKSGPATRNIATFPLTDDQENVYLELPGDA